MKELNAWSHSPSRSPAVLCMQASIILTLIRSLLSTVSIIRKASVRM